MGKRRADNTFRKPLDLWEAPVGAGEPLVCIVTSFTFDSTFFETECLGRFLQMDTHPSESESVGYLIEREEKLAAATVCALVDRRHARDKGSLRWDVLGVLVPRAIQHSKVSLLAWAKHVRVVIGSGNITEPGYRKNLEVFGTIDTSETEGGDNSSILQAMEFLGEVLRLAIGDQVPEGPKRRAREALASVRRQIKTWPTVVTNSRIAVPVFGLPGQGVLSRFKELWPSAGPPRIAHVLSPFFDCPPRDGVAVDALVKLLAKKGDRGVRFYVRADNLADGRIRAYAPKGMIKLAAKTCNVGVSRVSPEQNGEIRALHAKMLILGNREWQMLLIGSSNFTTSGLGAIDGRSSCEANLVYCMRTSDSDFSVFDDLWPEQCDEDLDPESDAIIWDPVREEDEDGVFGPPLPAAFQEAIFVPGVKPSLRIVLAQGLPAVWAIRIPDGPSVLSASDSAGAGTHNIDWTARPVPFVLEVSWKSDESVAVASWPVNVSNPAALPPPDAFRNLTLEELLEILASVRSLPQAVVEVLRRRNNRPRRDIELNPLKRLDSQALLLRRTKRVAVALERLRERLEQPALVRDAFEWRLRGPIGPMTLAHALTQEAKLPGEAKFCLAELALALSRVNPKKAALGGLSKAVIIECLSTVIREIEIQTLELSSATATSPLDAYVKAAFLEAKRC
jgi:hypothetical protein